MNKPISNLIVVLISLLFMCGGCTSSKGEGFAIYLTRENIPPAQMEALSHVDITDQPIISIRDIITYNAQSHEMKLTDTAFNRVFQLEVPVRGKSFLVCIDKAPIYWGAFWTPISSISFNGVTIWKPYSLQGPAVITIELGYPSFSFYGGHDPRNSPEILKSLEQAGKLINKLSITAVNKLPHSMKGYELYSWLENGEWHFTLITGTNRNKTLEEIISKEDFISVARWVKVQVMGIDAIKNVLSKLPQDEPVSWLEGQFIVLPGPAEQTIKLQLPPGQIVEAVKEQARESGLNLAVSQPSLPQ